MICFAIIVLIVFIPYLAHSVKRSLSAIGKEIMITDINNALWSNTSLTEDDRAFLKGVIVDLDNNSVSEVKIRRAESLIYR